MPRLYSCSEDTLVLLVRPDALASPAREAVARWLSEHGVPVDTLVVGRPIVRDVANTALTWHAHGPDAVQVHTQYPPLGPGTWPRPFPSCLTRSQRADPRLRD